MDRARVMGAVTRMAEDLRDSKSNRADRLRVEETAGAAVTKVIVATAAEAVGRKDNSLSLNRSFGNRLRSRFTDSRKTGCLRDKPGNKNEISSSRLLNRFGDSNSNNKCGVNNLSRSGVSNKPSRYIECLRDRRRSKSDRFTPKHRFMTILGEEMVEVGSSVRM